MKTKKFKFKQLLKLHLLKSRVYEYPVKKTNFNDLENSNLDQVLVGVKKVLQIIFQYDQTNKRILFIGLPAKLELKINSETRHAAVSNSFNIQGLISNNNINLASNLKISTQMTTKYDSTFLLSPKLVKKPDLIVLFDHPKSSTVLLEAWIAKIPTIVFMATTDLQDLLLKSSYFIHGNFKNVLATSDKNIILIGLNFLFKNLRKTKLTLNSAVSKSNSQFFNKYTKESRPQNRR